MGGGLFYFASFLDNWLYSAGGFNGDPQAVIASGPFLKTLPVDLSSQGWTVMPLTALASGWVSDGILGSGWVPSPTDQSSAESSVSTSSWDIFSA